jgi:membrane associated rhomboid family serine protease
MRPSRRYMRSPNRGWKAGTPPATALLIGLQVAAFAAQSLFELVATEPLAPAAWLQQGFALSGAGIAAGHYWQFLSFFWIHLGPWPLHLLANMGLLYWAGREVEPILGPRHLTAIYLLGNVAGGVVHLIGMPGIPLLGASAGVAAVLTAYGTILPELDLLSLRVKGRALRLRTKHLGVVVALGAALLWITGIALSLGPVAILVGALCGWLYVEKLGFGMPLAVQRYFFEKRRRQERFEQMSPEEFIHSEVDPILEKISRSGLRSLTRAERKILERGREKISPRDEAE